MLQNAYLLTKIGADTAENKRNSAEILPKICNYPTGPLPVQREVPPPRRHAHGPHPPRPARLPLLRREGHHLHPGAHRPGPMLALTQVSNYLALKGSFSAVSKPSFASKYALELAICSKRRLRTRGHRDA